MKNVVAYTRVSTDGQVGEDRFGLESQRTMIQDYCDQHDMNIVRWFTDEGESGAKTRPGFDEICFGETVSNPPYEAVIVAKTDRVARDINIYYYYKMLLRKKDLELISVTEDFGQMGVFSTMLEAFTMCCAQMERENITKRTAGGRKVKAAKGGYSGGHAPLGYSVENGCLVINEQEAPVVRKLFELRDAGSTLQAVADALNDMGYKTRKGGAFHASTVKYIDDNRKTYEGFYRYGKSAEWVRGQHAPIL